MLILGGIATATMDDCWALDIESVAITDKSGALWPLDGFVWDETSTTDDATVWVTRLPKPKVRL